MSSWRKYKNSVSSYALGDDWIYYNDDDATTQSLSFIKLKQINVNSIDPSPVTIRVHFEFRSAVSEYASAEAQIYKNGTPHGTLQSSSKGAWYSGDEDLEFSNGDTIEVWANNSSGSYTTLVRNFRIRGISTEMFITP